MGHVAGRVTQIEPRATREFEHNALTSIGGGPLAVEQHPDNNRYHLVQPRFTAKASISNGERRRRSHIRALKPGQVAVVAMQSAPQPVANLFYRRVRGWVVATISLATGQHANAAS
jgi:hypothetical protein